MRIRSVAKRDNGIVSNTRDNEICSCLASSIVPQVIKATPELITE